ncbi:MAG TPA: cytochrome c [Verrucomicrobiae bacterium]|nr:cytochrome c [Verrucomicrobiae bacterium]
MSRTRAIALILCAAIVGFSSDYIVRKHVIDLLHGQNVLLQRQLQQARMERQAALDKANAREAELEKVREDSLALKRLREQMKSNSIPANLPTGFYLGTDEPVFVTYGTSNVVLRAFIHSIMESSGNSEDKGREIFEKICAACHQPDGNGKDGVAPPLVGSEWVLAPGGERLARIVLNGLSGPITVKGRQWNLVMPPWRQNLDDDAIAVVLNYIRSGLGTNKAAAIRTDLVGHAREEQHPGPETVAELLQISVK